MIESNRIALGLADIIIVNFNSSESVAACLESIFLTGLDNTGKVFVWDNGSRENPRENLDAILQRFPQINLIQNQHNFGFARAVNAVIKQSHSRYLVILNPDTVIKEGFFQPVISYMESNLVVGILGPKIVNTDGSVQGSARSFPTGLTPFFGRTSLLTRLFPSNLISRKNVLTSDTDGSSPIPVDWVSGACMVVRRKAVETTGLMDERFFLYWEDADWCRRMWQQGWKVVYFPEATVVHHVGQSSRTRLFRSEFDFHVSAYRLFSKYSKGIWKLLKPAVALGLGFRFVVRSVAKALGL